MTMTAIDVNTPTAFTPLDAAGREAFMAGIDDWAYKLALRFARKVNRPDLAADLHADLIAHLWAKLDRYDSGRSLPTTWVAEVAWRRFSRALGELGYPCRLPANVMHGPADTGDGLAGSVVAAPASRRAPLRAGSARPRRGEPDGGEYDPPDRREAGPGEAAELAEQVARLRDALSSLTDRERRAISARYGLDGRGPRNLREIGREAGVTSESARQAVERGLRRLRAILGGDGMKGGGI